LLAQKVTKGPKDYGFFVGSSYVGFCTTVASASVLLLLDISKAFYGEVNREFTNKN
jgi:hypothetical protein